MVKLILTIIATMNMNMADTHSVEYEPVVIETSDYVYQIEEDYSISQTTKGSN